MLRHKEKSCSFFLSSQINSFHEPLQFISLLYLQRKGSVNLNKHLNIHIYIPREHMYGNIKYMHAQRHTYLAKERREDTQISVHIQGSAPLEKMDISAKCYT